MQQSNRSEIIAAIASPLTHDGFQKAYGMTRREAAKLLRTGGKLPTTATQVPKSNQNLFPTLDSGPGTRLKKRIAAFGINPKEDCKCLRVASEMDAKGGDWCLENIDAIADEIANEFNSRGWTETVLKAIVASPIEAFKLAVAGGSIRGAIVRMIRDACEPPDSFLVVPKVGVSYMGISEPKPWQYRVACAIPHFESLDTLPIVVELLRLQTERPYILVIDTGSCAATHEQLEKMRAKDLEVHSIQAHGWQHPSEPIAAAMDLAMAVCRPEYLFCTHSDVFLRRRDFIESLLGHNVPAIGYEITDRSHVTSDWMGMVSHTATLLNMSAMRKIGASWSIHRACELLGLPPDSRVGWPDTETGINLIMRAAGITPTLIGVEANDERCVDENIDHVRSLSSRRLYAGGAGKRSEWLEAALKDASERITKWRGAEGRSG